MLNGGINLALYIGPAVPIPASQEVIDALTGVTVTITSGNASGFELTFTLDNRSPLQTLFLLSGGAAPPLIRVIIAVTVNGITNVLMDGVVTRTQIAPDSGGGGTTLTVVGEDLSRVLDYISFTGLIPYPVMPAEARVALIVAKYAVLGVVPLVIPSPLIDVPLPVERIPYHRGTDLQYIKSLAARVGYVFYMMPGPEPGISFAYWGPQLRVGPAQPALNIDMGPETNIESASCTFDSTMTEMPVILIQNQLTKVPIPIPIPAVNPLSPPLGIIPPLPKSFPVVADTAKNNFVQAALIGLARAAQSAQAARVTGALDVLRYGRVLKARELVGLRGVGPAFEGLYYVDGVTHTIKRGEYKQNFTLVRNGLLSTVQQVPA